MKLLFLGILIFSTAAISAEDVRDPLRDAVISEVQLKAMQGRVDAATSKIVAETLKNEVPPLPYYQSAVAFRSANMDGMTAAFNEAKVPDCLHSDGLKRQSTFFIAGYLALPFIAVAKVRGSVSDIAAVTGQPPALVAEIAGGGLRRAGTPKDRGRTPYGVRPLCAAVRVARFPLTQQ